MNTCIIIIIIIHPTPAPIQCTLRFISNITGGLYVSIYALPGYN